MNSNKKALIVGLGIGQLYLKVLKDLGCSVVTVDLDSTKSPDYTNLDDVLGMSFDISYIGTPNYTHESIARKIADISNVVLIEKPGVENSERWVKLLADFPRTKFLMVKNNQYREEIKTFRNLFEKSSDIAVCWNRKNCIPNPGSWFTDKSKSFGGVSRDLIPHMLSYYTELADFDKGVNVFVDSKQCHTLETIVDTEYGAIDRNGVYNVDDCCEIQIKNQCLWKFEANWKSGKDDNSSITFRIEDRDYRFELGWCPEEAYKKMLLEIFSNLNNNKFWNDQNRQDLWIHRQLENL